MIDRTALDTYYGQLPREGSLVRACRMALAEVPLCGARVVDVGCRRGKGAYKLSDAVGAQGTVIAVDWNPSFLEEARAGMSRALERSGLAASNLEFRWGYPEDLGAADVCDGSADVVYVNNGISLFYDPAAAVAECARVLKAEGLLVLEAVVVDGVPDEAVVQQARAVGDSVRAARTEDDVRQWLACAGFEEPRVVESFAVSPSCEDADIGNEARAAVNPRATSPSYQVMVFHAHKKPPTAR